jgi:hypothetical protein
MTKQHTEHPKVRRAEANYAGHRPDNPKKSQAKAGQIDAARRGMMKIMRRRGN